MQMLSQLDVQGDSALRGLADFLAEWKANPATGEYVEEIVCACWSDRAAVDRRIAEHLEHWGLERLSPVERNVIRVGLLELSRGQVPPKVVINEAVEIGREYGGADSPKFINGILDALWKQEHTAGK